VTSLPEFRGRAGKAIWIMYTAEAKEAQKLNIEYIQSLQKQHSAQTLVYIQDSLTSSSRGSYRPCRQLITDHSFSNFT
jgi:hypothetical protein